MKPYDVGLICGRFQTYHIGHESLINMGTQLCDRILILIGSSHKNEDAERDIRGFAGNHDLCTV